MSIKINISQNLRRFTNNRHTVEVNGTTIGECINDLISQYPNIKEKLISKDGALLVLISVNGEIVYHKNISKRVANEDQLQLIPILAGG